MLVNSITNWMSLHNWVMEKHTTLTELSHKMRFLSWKMPCKILLHLMVWGWINSFALSLSYKIIAHLMGHKMLSMNIMVFWDIMTSTSANRYQHSCGTICVHFQLQSKADEARSSEMTAPMYKMTHSRTTEDQNHDNHTDQNLSFLIKNPLHRVFLSLHDDSI